MTSASPIASFELSSLSKSLQGDSGPASSGSGPGVESDQNELLTVSSAPAP